MTDSNIPKAFGVFKPIGYIVASFRDDPTAKLAADAFVQAGFAPGDVHLAISQDVVEHAGQDVAGAGFPASVGQDLNLIKEHLELAKQGHGFVTVRSPDEASAKRITAIAESFGADRAQQYGRFLTEELIEPGTGERQVAESADRGLDAQTPSGREGAVR